MNRTRQQKPVPSLAERQAKPLSETLTGVRSPQHCQACSKQLPVAQLMRWIECDEWDRATSVVVILCSACTDRLIDKHPRLYQPMLMNYPKPGTMEICIACSWRSHTNCIAARARHNGGKGMTITIKKPTIAFLCPGGRKTIYHEPAKACSSRLVPTNPMEIHNADKQDSNPARD